jgi:hypothetical protein
MSAYQEARQRRDRAVDALLAALAAKAEADARFVAAGAEAEAATLEVHRHEIDPEYQENRERVPA